MGQSTSKGEKKKKLTPEELQKIEKQLKRRREILREIVETERRYVEALDICVKQYLQPLKDSKILKEDDIKQIFSIVEIIASLHQDLFTQLQDRVQHETNDDKLSISDIFIQRSSFLKMYTTYINNYDVAINTLVDIQDKNEDFEEFLKVKAREPETRQLDLESYLIAPVQRLPRYVLLFNDLVNNTPQSHDDYLPLVETLKEIKSVVYYVNEEKRNSESTKKMMEISSTTQSKVSIVEPHRKFIAECDCSVKSLVKTSNSNNTPQTKNFSGNDQTSKLFLFNDSVMLVKPTLILFDPSIKYAVRSFAKLDDIAIADVIDAEDTKNTFKITFQRDFEDTPKKGIFTWINVTTQNQDATTNTPPPSKITIKTYTISTNQKPIFFKALQAAQQQYLDAKQEAQSGSRKTKKMKRQTLLAMFSIGSEDNNTNNRNSVIKTKSKDTEQKEKDKPKEKEQNKEKAEKEKEKERQGKEKEQEREQQEKEKQKEKEKEQKEKERMEKEKEKEKEKEREQQEKVKQKEKELKEKEKAEKEREIEKQKEKERKEKEKEKQQKEKEKEKLKKQKEKEKQKKKKKEEGGIMDRVSGFFEQ